MRYRVTAAWPVMGGAVVVPGGTIIDDSSNAHFSSLVRGVIPPPDVTPFNQATRDWLMNAYRGHGIMIPAVEKE